MASNPPPTSGASSSGGSVGARSSARASTIGVGYAAKRASTGSDLDNLYRYVDSVKGMMDAKIEAVTSKVEGQVAAVMAEFRVAEATRSTEFQQVQSDFSDLKNTLPSKEDISRSTRNWALGLGGFVVAIAGLLWAFFGAGASITGALADRIIDTKSDQKEIQTKLDQLLEAKRSDNTQGSQRQRATGSVRKGT